MLSEKRPDEELKQLANTLEQIKKEDLLDMLVETLQLYGEYVEGFGKIHRKYEKVYDITNDLTKSPISPELVGYLADKASPEVAGIFLKIMLKLTSIAPQMNRLMELSAAEKIQLGKDIKSVAKDFQKLKTEGET